MSRHFYLPILALITFFVALSSAAFANPPVGKPAPDFETVDIEGKPLKLSDLKGQKVILEWTNHQCPFVVKHYGGGNMQATQKTATAQGATWISIISSAPGRQGHVSAKEAKDLATARGAAPTHQILDPSGEIGHLYGAQTTPHMFIIDEDGILAYKGAIDSKASLSPATIPNATNYVLAALESMNAGEPIAHAVTPPYGCSIKYAH